MTPLPPEMTNVIFFSWEVSSSIIHNVTLSEWVSVIDWTKLKLSFIFVCPCTFLITSSVSVIFYCCTIQINVSCPCVMSVSVHSSLYTCTLNWFSVHLYFKLVLCTLVLKTGYNLSSSQEPSKCLFNLEQDQDVKD